jgi:hypothetical protein
VLGPTQSHSASLNVNKAGDVRPRRIRTVEEAECCANTRNEWMVEKQPVRWRRLSLHRVIQLRQVIQATVRVYLQTQKGVDTWTAFTLGIAQYRQVSKAGQVPVLYSTY